MSRNYAILGLLLTTLTLGTASASYEETCTDVDPAGVVQRCDYEGTYAPARCGAPAQGSFSGTYFAVAGTYIVDAGTLEESQPSSGYASSGAWADDGLGLTYVEAFTYENNCQHGNGAAVVAFVGPAGAIVHVNDAEGAAVTPFLP